MMDSQPATPMDVSCLQAPSPADSMEVVHSPCDSGLTDHNGVSQMTPISFQGLQDEDSIGSPPVDERSLHETLARNREKLKVKLLTRRPIHQLVQQGIIPREYIALKASPQFLEQKQRLERAKMGDFLKNKMQHRPDRDTLIRAHILEDTSAKVDPSLQEKQRRLKRARLKDDLNDRLAHRPGPLELIRGNILQADETFAQAIKEGTIPFKRTCEGDIVTPVDVVSESSDDSQQGTPIEMATGSRGGSPPQAGVSASLTNGNNISNNRGTSGFTQSAPIPAVPTASIVTPTRVETINITNAVVGSGTPGASTTLLVTAGGDGHPLIVCAEPTRPSQPAVKAIAQQPTPMSTTPVYFTLATTGQAAPNGATTVVKQRSLSTIPMTLTTNQGLTTSTTTVAGSKKKSSLSTKPTQSTASLQTNKNRIIKFHEYKGPPSAMKEKEVNEKKETSYELLLQQQKVFLQWQMDNGQALVNGSKQKMILPAPSSPFQTANSMSSEAYKLKCAKLEDMKVSDLKVELKKRNLPVSGSKPQLIERLKPFSDEIASTKTEPNTLMDSAQVSANSNVVSSNSSTTLPNADVVTEDGTIAFSNGDQDSVMVKMDILHKELLEKQRLQNIFQQQQLSGPQQNNQPAQQANVITITDGKGGDQTIQVNRVLCQSGVQIIHGKPQLVTLQVAKPSDGTHSPAGLINVPGLTTSQNIAIVSQVASSSGGTGGSGGALQKIQSPQHIHVKQVQHIVPVKAASAVVNQLAKPLCQPQSALQLQQQNGTTAQIKHVSLAKQTVQAGKVQQVHLKTQSSSPQLQQNQTRASQSKSPTLPRQLLQHKILLQPASIVASSLGTAAPNDARNAAAPTMKPLPVERKNSLTHEGSRNHTRTHSLPGDIRELLRKPPEYGGAAAIKDSQHISNCSRESCEVNLNDIFEIISNQEQPAQFEVTRNPDTGVVTLKEATNDTPKTSHIITSDIKPPVLIDDLTIPLNLERGELEKPHQLAHLSGSAGRSDVNLLQSLPNGVTLDTTVSKVPGQGESPEVKDPTAVDNTSQSLKGMFGVLDKSQVHGTTLQSPEKLNVCGKEDAMTREQTEKTLDFHVDLDALETLDINFDIINEDNNNKQQSQHTFRSLDAESMSTDFQDLDWWSNELFQMKHHTSMDTSSDQGTSCGSRAEPSSVSETSAQGVASSSNIDSDNLRTPDVNLSPLSLSDPLLSFSNAHSCGFAEHKASSGVNNNSLLGPPFGQTGHHSPAISLYSDMQGLLCDDVVMTDWTTPQPHSFDIHMQM